MLRVLPMLIRSEYSASQTVQRSRFFAVLFPATSEDEVKVMLARRRKEVKKACHHCLAARFVSDAGGVTELARDDGEVGRPGHKLLDLLRRHDIQGALVISRVFGGIKLGPAGVGRAFVNTGLAVLERAMAAHR